MQDLSCMEMNEYNVLQKVKYDDEYNDWLKTMRDKKAGKNSAATRITTQQLELMEDAISGNL